MNLGDFINFLGACVIVAPTILFFLLGAASLLRLKLSEKTIAVATQIAVSTSLLASAGVLIYMLATGIRQLPVNFGHWVEIGDEHFHFHLKFVFDRLSVPFTIMTAMLTGVVGAFANRYLHRENGYNRFFLLYSVFLLGMTLASLAGTIETLFLGWELVGLSSALLVAYFHERRPPVENGQRVWGVYRFSDAAFLMAALTMHHYHGEGDFSIITGHGAWPNGVAELTPLQALPVGLLLLIAAAGKSGLIPFSGWLPRAMEGPTPSSAVFYGALSVHLGAYLLLRVSPILEQSIVLQATVVALGLSSALLGAVCGSVQSDVKSSLAYSSVTQVGIITAEIGLGWYYVALVHTIGHAFMRTLQLLRAPSLLRDYRVVENATGQAVVAAQANHAAAEAKGYKLWVYRLAFERGGLDAFLDRFFIDPFLSFFRLCMRIENGCMKRLSKPSRDEAKGSQSSVSSEGA